MEYNMEELVPLVARLTRRYTSLESSSVTYETAQMLMAAVIYCIDENFRDDGNQALSAETALNAAVYYQKGKQKVVEKVRRAKALYDQITEDFEDCGCRNYRETILDGMPAFFLRYDAEFKPQDHLLTVDYPTLIPVSELTGVDFIYEYLQRIAWEQQLLGQFDRSAVIGLLNDIVPDYQDIYMDNLCYPVLLTALLCIISDQPVRYLQLEAESRQKIGGYFGGDSTAAVTEKFRSLIRLTGRQFQLEESYFIQLAATYSQIWSSFLDNVFR